MKRILFAAALAALFATSASADDKSAAPATPAPVVTAAPTVEMAPATNSGTRRGLLSRLRDRRGGSTMSAPTMSTPTMTAPGTIVPSTPAPMPMPGTTVPKPMPSGGTTGTTLTPAGGTATGGEIVTAGYSEPATSSTMRRGLFSRIRNR